MWMDVACVHGLPNSVLILLASPHLSSLHDPMVERADYSLSTSGLLICSVASPRAHIPPVIPSASEKGRGRALKTYRGRSIRSSLTHRTL